MVFRALPPTGHKGSQTRQATGSLIGVFAESHPAPGEVAFRAPLSA